MSRLRHAADPAWAAETSLRLTAGESADTVEIGFVAIDEAIYVRAYRGPDSAWFRAARDAGRGRITLRDSTIEVRLDLAGIDLDVIDAAFTRKYGAMAAALVTTPTARAATLRVASALDHRPE